jgi:uncharacterized protein RhaS with RHS repeats
MQISLICHLQSNTLELGDKAQTLSYEHYYPYGSTAIIAGKDKTQVQQKRYRYTGKERDDSSGLCYYGARYLAPWLKPTPRDKRKMPCRIDIFKRIITHTNIQIQAINRPC